MTPNLTPNQFEALKQREMYEELKKTWPDKAVGKSRARKDELLRIYTEAFSAVHPTGRIQCELPMHTEAEQSGSLSDEADLASMELRFLASLRNSFEELANATDEQLFQFFGTEDPYVIVASIIYDVPVEDVTSHQRYSAKLATYKECYAVNPAEPPEGVDPDDWAVLRQRLRESFPAAVRLMKSDIEEVISSLPNGAPKKGRRDEVRAALRVLRDKDVRLLSEWKRTSEHNRHGKRRRAALARKLRKVLPADVTLSEAAQVVA